MGTLTTIQTLYGYKLDFDLVSTDSFNKTLDAGVNHYFSGIYIVRSDVSGGSGVKLVLYLKAKNGSWFISVNTGYVLTNNYVLIKEGAFQEIKILGNSSFDNSAKISVIIIKK